MGNYLVLQGMVIIAINKPGICFVSGCSCLLIVSSEPRLFLPQGYLHLSLFGTVVEPGQAGMEAHHWPLWCGHLAE